MRMDVFHFSLLNKMFGLFCMFITSAHLAHFSLFTPQRFLLSDLNNPFCPQPVTFTPWRARVSRGNMNFKL